MRSPTRTITGSGEIGAVWNITGANLDSYLELASNDSDATASFVIRREQTATSGINAIQSIYNSTATSGNEPLPYIAAAPEPSSWFLLLGGLGLLAFIRRRRA